MIQKKIVTCGTLFSSSCLSVAVTRHSYNFTPEHFAQSAIQDERCETSEGSWPESVKP